MELLTILLSAGGAAFFVAVFNGIRSLRNNKTETEEALLNRIDSRAEQAFQDADAQRQRAINAERQTDTFKKQRDEALEEASRLRLLLSDHGISHEKLAVENSEK